MALDEQQRLDRAERIRQLREESPYTQAAIADLVGVTPRAYQRWEEGGGIEWDHLERLAEIHDVDVMWIHRAAGRGPTPLEVFSASASESELAEQVRRTNSELAEVRGELSEVRTELERVLSQLLRDARDREAQHNG